MNLWGFSSNKKYGANNITSICNKPKNDNQHMNSIVKCIRFSYFFNFYIDTLDIILFIKGIYFTIYSVSLPPPPYLLLWQLIFLIAGSVFVTKLFYSGNCSLFVCLFLFLVFVLDKVLHLFIWCVFSGSTYAAFHRCRVFRPLFWWLWSFLLYYTFTNISTTLN